MKKRFAEQQIAFALRQAEARTPVAEITRKMGVSEPACTEQQEMKGNVLFFA